MSFLFLENFLLDFDYFTFFLLEWGKPSYYCDQMALTDGHFSTRIYLKKKLKYLMKW